MVEPNVKLRQQGSVLGPAYLFAVVQEVTGGDRRADKPTFGVNIAIVDA